MSDANSSQDRAPLDLRDEPGSTATTERPAAAPARRREPGSVSVLLDDDRTLVVLAGDVDATLAADLVEAATEVRETGRAVRVDTRHVTFMDSTGVSFMARVAVAGVGRPVLLDPPDHVRFLLEITAIGALVDLEEPAVGASTPETPTGDDAT